MSPWQINSCADVGAGMFCPGVLPDNVARCQVFDATASPFAQTTGGKDMFGVEWEFVAVAGGAMVRPGQPRAEDANDLESVITWPDIDSWDWAGSRAAKYCKSGKTSMLSMYASPLLELMMGVKPPINGPFLEELYIQSRKNYINND